MSYLIIFLVSLFTLIIFILIQLFRKKIITKRFYKNKDFIKYLVFITTLTILISFLFLEKYGNFIPNIMEYFTPENVQKLNIEGRYKGKDLNIQDQYIINLGYLGSFLAGTLGLIFGFLSLIFLVFTFLNQSRKNEVSDVENRIFKLIELLVEIKNQNNLSIISQNFLERNKELSNLETLKNNLKEQHLDFSNFFRMLYQILKYIHEHEHIIHNRYCDQILDPQVKSYTNIIRSYLDTNLLTCLAINCYCLEKENGEYTNYKELLERYELLEHLPNILPMQFSSYLYYDEKAFGQSTWFKEFKSIREELINIANTFSTTDFCEIFLLFLSKNNGLWINGKVRVEIIKDKYYKLSINCISDTENFGIIRFEILKNTLQVSKSPYNIKNENFMTRIFKENNHLTITYYKPKQSYIFANLVTIRFLIINTDSVEMELISGEKDYSLPIS